MRIENVTYQNRLLATAFIYAGPVTGTNFLTPSDSPQQFGIASHAAGVSIQAHKHVSAPDSRPFRYSELLIVKKGKIKVLLFSESGDHVTNLVLEEGDSILLLAGGHGIEMLEDSEIYEVKPGPYESQDAGVAIGVTSQLGRGK